MTPFLFAVIVPLCVFAACLAILFTADPEDTP
jgi:hypothetical protein